jgi:phospholipid/cholesterol/gamma-HCH transport system substrate-binding protein
MNQSTETTQSTKLKVGIFTILGLLLIGAMTVLVNDHPYWWRSCQLVHINVEDGTGLKSKSPVKSLGIDIGYLSTVDLSETHVDLGICITAPVEVLPATRAYMRGEGFLGDKFVELKPVKYVGPRSESRPPHEGPGSGPGDPAAQHTMLEWLMPSAYAAELIPSAQAAPANPPAPGNKKGGREIPVGEQGQDIQHLVGRVDELVNEMTNLTTNIKQAINPEELRSTMKQLNRTLENASRTLSPEGGLNQTAQRTLGKLEDAIEQLRDQMTRVNKGEGSVGMLLNDPQYAEEIREAIRNVNRLLSKVGGIRFVVDVGGEQINAYNGGRGFFRLSIFPNPSRYYLLGISIDPRGQISRKNTQTCVGGTCNSVSSFETEATGLLFTAMIGKIFYNRLDLSLGALNGDGALSTSIRLGPSLHEELLVLRNDVYSRGAGLGTDDRVTAIIRPWAGSPSPLSALYFRGGVEGFKTVPASGARPYFYGAGITFDDEDIKILFTLR